MTSALPVELNVHVDTSGITAVRSGRFRIDSPRKTMSTISVYFVLALVALFFIAPLLWIVLSSFEPGAAIGTNAPLVLTLSNFAKVLNWSTFFQPLVNSLIISGSTAVLVVLTSLFAAYPLSRYQMRYRRVFLYTIIFSTGLPITAIMVRPLQPGRQLPRLGPVPDGDVSALWDMAHEGLHGRGTRGP